MHAIVNAEKASDYVVATGATHSVRELCDYVFTQLDLDYKDYVSQNPKYMRPQELKYLRGDSTRIRTELDWKPAYTFETLLDEMIQHWVRVLA
jgi:GDPmannose 4,6-dehydratase